MNVRLVVAGSFVAVAVIACTPQEEAAESGGAWVGTINAEDNVTTVVNESGSVWGGSARLVEEASIGVDVGEPLYMLGDVTSVTADSERIYVLDRQPPVLRVYDFDGRHLLDMGREGQGPGEFDSPSSVVVLDDGRVLVRDDSNSRFNVFDGAAELLDTWPYGDGGYWASAATVVGADGTLYRPEPRRRNPEDLMSTWGFLALSAEGVAGEYSFPPELDYERPQLRGENSGGPVPLSPPGIVELSPNGWLVGVGDEYRFELQGFDGTTLVVERRVARAPASDAERAWRTLLATARRRRNDPQWTWNGPPVPPILPAFATLYADADGRIWVVRFLPSVPVEDCTEEPQPGEPVVACWQHRHATDVFGPDGRYLGEVESPQSDGAVQIERGYARGDLVLLETEDEAGTVMVKRYRLVLPGEEGG